jgi:hypothetical protein
LSDDEADLSFRAAMSAFMAVISVVRDFRDSSTSTMVGSVMAGGGAEETAADWGDGVGLLWWAAAVED